MDELTPKQIERILTNEDWEIRYRFAWRTDFVPTPEQIERGLTDEDWDIRYRFAKRTDFVPTPAQIERGLTDKDWNVRYMFEKQQPEWLKKRNELSHVSQTKKRVL